MHSKQLFALDLGTTKFCLAALLWGNGDLRLEIVEITADGMHRGMVADFTKAERCLKELIEKAEKSRDENNGRQGLERKNKAGWAIDFRQ